MDQGKIDEAMRDWKEHAEKAQEAGNLAAGNASTINFSHNQNDKLQKYLEKYIDGYLFNDLESIKENIKPGKQSGNASYPMILSICAGMEFLGALLRPSIDDVYSRKKDGCYFGHYWKNYLATVNKKYVDELNGEIARDLIRNGLAHHFIIKHGIGSVRSQKDRHLEISKHEKVLVIDADQLFADFKKSYEKIAKPKLLDGASGQTLAAERLNQILDEYEQEDSFKRLSKKIQSAGDEEQSSQTTTLPPVLEK